MADRSQPAGRAPRWRRIVTAVDGGARTLGALVGTVPVAILVAAALAAFVPLPADVRFLLAVLLAIPLWVAAMCAAFLAPRGWQVWLAVAVTTVVLSLLIPTASLI